MCLISFIKKCFSKKKKDIDTFDFIIEYDIPEDECKEFDCI